MIRLSSLLFALCAFVLAACPGTQDPMDSGPAPEPEQDAGINYTCSGGEDVVYPLSVVEQNLSAFDDSGCTEIDGVITMTPGMLERSDALRRLVKARAIRIEGSYPQGTNFSELGGITTLNRIETSASGVVSLSGFSGIEELPSGLHVFAGADLVTIGMRNLRLLGDADDDRPPTRGNSGLSLEGLPVFESLNVSDALVLEAGPLRLMNLPRMDPDEIRALTEEWVQLPDDIRGQDESYFCELPPEGGPNVDMPCP